MKRDFLKSLGLEDEAIDKIMSENGKDLEKAKQANEKTVQELEKTKSELEAKDQLINDANAEIEKYKGMDIDGIKKSADEWKTKYETDTAEFQKKLQEKDYDFAVDKFMSQHKFVSDFTRNAFVEDFKKQGLKLGEDGKFLGADDYIKGFQEKNAGVFMVEEAPRELIPEIVKPTDTSNQNNNNNGFNFNFRTVRPVPNE